MKPTNDPLAQFTARLQEFAELKSRELLSLKPGVKVVCEVRFVEIPPISEVIVIQPGSTLDARHERQFRKRQLFDDADWHQILKLNWEPERFGALLQQIRSNGADEVPVSKLDMGTPDDHVRINAVLRKMSLPHRIYMKGKRGCTWTHGSLITYKICFPS